jgi:hypothetical protein
LSFNKFDIENGNSLAPNTIAKTSAQFASLAQLTSSDAKLTTNAWWLWQLSEAITD